MYSANLSCVQNILLSLIRTNNKVLRGGFMDDEQLLRYSRQILLPDVDIDGQQALLDAKVLIIGMGGLGSPVAMYLAAAGVGHLYLSDFDTVDLSNLQRQIVHGEADIGKSKVTSACETLADINPLINLTPITEKLDAQQLLAYATEVDVVVDCTDNLATRFMINEACVQARKPLVSGAAIRLEGQITVYPNQDNNTACYRCLYRQETLPTETCSQTGVIAPLVGIIGSMQALETMKVIMGLGESLAGRLLLLDASTMEWCEMALSKNPQCPVCATATE